jgi:hypothetical protein
MLIVNHILKTYYTKVLKTLKLFFACYYLKVHLYITISFNNYI